MQSACPAWLWDDYPIISVAPQWQIIDATFGGRNATHNPVQFYRWHRRQEGLKSRLNAARRKPRLGGRWLTYSAMVPKGFTSHRAARRATARAIAAVGQP